MQLLKTNSKQEKSNGLDQFPDHRIPPLPGDPFCYLLAPSSKFELTDRGCHVDDLKSEIQRPPKPTAIHCRRFISAGGRRIEVVAVVDAGGKRLKRQ